MSTELIVESPADFHVHLRQGELSEIVTPHVRKGGFDLAYVMVSDLALTTLRSSSERQPNLNPPITKTEQAIKYREQLKAIDSNVDYLMTLYLSPDLTPEEVRKAKEAGIVGVKSYPRGVTTNSDGGIESYEVYYPAFEEMQKCDLVLNLHGEVPSDAASVSSYGMPRCTL